MKNIKTGLRILKLVLSFLPLLILSLIFAVINVISQLFIPVLTGNAIDAMVGAGLVDFDGVKDVLVKFVIALCANGISTFCMTLINNRVTFMVVKNLRNKMFDKLTKVPVSYVDSHSHGDIMSRMISDVERVSDGLLLGFSELFTGSLTIIGTLVFMIRINFWISLVVIVLTPVSLLVASFISRKTYKHFKEQASLQGKLTSFINETITGVKVIKAFNAESRKEEKFEEINRTYAKTNLKALFFSSTTNPATRFVNGLVYSGVGIIGALLGAGGRLTIGTLTCFLSYANQYTKPFNEISGVITEFQNAIACATRIFEMLDATEEEGAFDSKAFNAKFDGNIEISNLAFSYVPDKKLLHDISFKVNKGMKVAIVGPTGSGKTTFINLLMRFYDPDEGQILIDGVPTVDIPKAVLRRNVGMVLQETWLKAGTVFENIAYGKPDATREEVIEAAKKAHAHSFIQRLENGYDTVLSSFGKNLSEGQKQLLSIARLMLVLPPVLILDEATSSIDTRTEVRVNKAFEIMMEGRTSFIVAHRLSTIENADLILVMKDGNIIETGNHEELLAQKGFYYSMVNSI